MGGERHRPVRSAAPRRHRLVVSIEARFAHAVD
jgi:hypothetical protein